MSHDQCHMINVIILNVIMLNAIMLNVQMLNVIMLSTIMLSISTFCVVVRSATMQCNFADHAESLNASLFVVSLYRMSWGQVDDCAR